MIKRLALVLALWPHVFTATGFAKVDPTPLHLGDRALAQGEFANAVSHYREGLKNGAINGHVFYNLGIAAYRQGHLGEAVAGFLAARRFLPRDPDVAANLKAALAGVSDKLEPKRAEEALYQRVFAWDAFATPREWLWLTSISAALVGLALCLTIWIQRWAYLRPWTLMGLIVPGILGLTCAGRFKEPDAWGAVNAPVAKIFAGPSAKNPVLFELKEGAPILATDRVEAGFVRVELSDGKRGWIADADVEIFGPIGHLGS